MLCGFPSVLFSNSSHTLSMPVFHFPFNVLCSVLQPTLGVSFLKIRVHCYFVFLKALMDLEKDSWPNEIDPPHHSCSFLPHSSTPEPSQQSASPLSAAESQESPGSNRPVVAGLRSAAAFKPVGSTSVKSPSWQRPNQAGIP